MGRVAVGQNPRFRVIFRIKQGDEPVGIFQVRIHHPVQMVQNSCGGMAVQHLSPQHTPGHGHDQASGHAFAHHIPDRDAPGGGFRAAEFCLGVATQAGGTIATNGDEVVIIATHPIGRFATGRQINTLDFGILARQQPQLNFGPNFQFPIEPFLFPQLNG